MKLKNNDKWVVKTLVPEEVYTDRKEFLDYFYNAAINAAKRGTTSTVLLGQRRMGKTEIFKRVVNRLFFEQDPKDPNAVVPVYYSFPDAKLDSVTFGIDYVENLLRYYVAFYTGNFKLIRERLSGDELIAIAKKAAPDTPSARMVDWIIATLKSFENGDSIIPHQDALRLPSRIANYQDSTIVMFLDEFHNTSLPEYEIEIAGFMRPAVEFPSCPHFVATSSTSKSAMDCEGKGAVRGRFVHKVIDGMTGYFGAELARKAAGYFGADVPEIMAPVVAKKCGGNPFYITSIVKRAARLKIPISDEKNLNKIVAVDLSSGFIWKELNNRVARGVGRSDEPDVAKWLMYFFALDENIEPERFNRFNIEKIQRELKNRVRKKIPRRILRYFMLDLSCGDLMIYMAGASFRRENDPILLEFLKVWGKIEVEGQDPLAVQEKLEDKYQTMKKRINEYKGYLAEVHMSQALLNSQNMTLPGAVFNMARDIQMPDRLIYVANCMRLGSGKGREIDVYGAAASEKWICQSKWLKKDKAGVGVLRELMAQADAVKREKAPRILRMWLFANNGLTAPARKMAEKNGILWSSRKELDKLLVHLGLRALPDL